MTRLAVIDPDGELVTTVEALLHREADVEIRAVETLDEVWSQLEADGVLVAGPSLAGKAGIAALQQVHRRAPAVRIVLAFDRRPGGSMKEVVAIGAEALVDPTDATELRSALDRALRSSREVVPLSLVGATDDRTEGRIVSVVSATGGCGKTFVAASLAASMAAWTGARVALVDLDLQFGEVAAALGMRPRHSFADLVGAPVEDVADYLDEVLLRHPTGIDVLAAPTDQAQADLVTSEAVAAVLDRLRATHDLVVVDTSTGLSELTLAALDRSDEVVLLALLDVASIRNLRTLDRTLDRLQVPASSRRLVLNKDRRGVGLSADEVERALDRTFVARVPFSEAVLRSTNTGHPVVLESTERDLVLPLSDVLLSVAPELHRDAIASRRPSAAETRRRWFRRRRGATPDVDGRGSPPADAPETPPPHGATTAPATDLEV